MRYLPLVLVGFLTSYSSPSAAKSPAPLTSDLYHDPQALEDPFDPTQRDLHRFTVLNHLLYQHFTDPSFSGGREQFTTPLYTFPHIGQVRLSLLHPLDHHIGLDPLTPDPENLQPARSDELTLIVLDTQGNQIVCQDAGIDGYNGMSRDKITLPQTLPAGKSPPQAAALCTSLAQRVNEALKTQEREKSEGDYPSNI